MEYLIILYYLFLAVALFLVVVSAGRDIAADIKTIMPVKITNTADKCPGCGGAITAGTIKCGHCAALINFLR